MPTNDFELTAPDLYNQNIADDKGACALITETRSYGIASNALQLVTSYHKGGFMSVKTLKQLKYIKTYTYFRIFVTSPLSLVFVTSLLFVMTLGRYNGTM